MPADIKQAIRLPRVAYSIDPIATAHGLIRVSIEGWMLHVEAAGTWGNSVAVRLPLNEADARLVDVLIKAAATYFGIAETWFDGLRQELANAR